MDGRILKLVVRTPLSSKLEQEEGEQTLVCRIRNVRDTIYLPLNRSEKKGVWLLCSECYVLGEGLRENGFYLKAGSVSRENFATTAGVGEGFDRGLDVHGDDIQVRRISDNADESLSIVPRIVEA